MSGGNGLGDIRRSECPTCGRVFTEGDGNVCHGPWALNQHEPAEWVRVEYVRADVHAGAVEALAQVAAWDCDSFPEDAWRMVAAAKDGVASLTAPGGRS